MILVGKAVFMIISLNAVEVVEGIYSHATCR